MDTGTELKNGVVVQPAMPLAALLRESKQLQVTSQQLIRESKELQTVLILFLHLHRNQRKQLKKQHELFMGLLLQNTDYQDKLAFLPHFHQWQRARQLTN